MEMKLELVAIPVSDVDRARDFYKDKLGFNLDHDHTVSEKLRFVQMTPLGSACSICDLPSSSSSFLRFLITL